MRSEGGEAKDFCSHCAIFVGHVESESVGVDRRFNCEFDETHEPTNASLLDVAHIVSHKLVRVIHDSTVIKAQHCLQSISDELSLWRFSFPNESLIFFVRNLHTFIYTLKRARSRI